MKVNIQATHDRKFPVELETSETALQLKEKVAEAQKIPLEEIRLIFSGRIMKDADTMESLKVVEGNTIHMVRTIKNKPPATTIPASTNVSASLEAPSQSSTTTTTTTTTTINSTSTPATTNPQGTTGRMPPSQPMAFPPSLLAQLGTGFGPGAATGAPPEMASMLNNPEMMRQMFEMIAANPQLMQAALQMNPAYRNAPPEIQQLMQRPEFLRMALELSLAQSGAAPNATDQESEPAQQEQYMGTLAALLSQGQQQPSIPPSNEPPEIRFQSQLQQLNEMGFYDPDANIRALLASGGNVHLAVERLLGNL